jgi:2-polyprenyl-3-methyl-5-hydroxy-6-metoxy-1,4-benzoquinol methylase
MSVINYVPKRNIYYYGGFIEEFSDTNIKIIGDDIVEIVSEGGGNGENSRFNYKTKECKHWYAITICDKILNSIEKNKKYKILVLGVALGGIIIHLLNKSKNIEIVGVDITDKNYDIVQKYSDNSRLKLIKDDAEIYMKNNNEKYDFIICDVFTEFSIPKFVTTTTFLNNIHRSLVNNGYFLINTIGINKDNLYNIYSDSFQPLNIDIVSLNLNDVSIIKK